MIEAILIAVVIVLVIVALARDRSEVPPPAFMEGGGSHLRSRPRDDI